MSKTLEDKARKFEIENFYSGEKEGGGQITKSEKMCVG